MDFVGREDELELLRGAWQHALNREPQIVALVGESRLGKTRIVQEFYHWLNRTQDPENYWPDSLPRTDDSLQVNPLFVDHEAQGRTPPWLWWGVRWTRPAQRNADEAPRCAVVADAGHLRPHVDTARRAFERKRSERDAWVGVGKTAVNLATGGTAGSAIEVFERLQEWWKLRGQHADSAPSVAETAVRQHDGELRELLDFLVALAGSDRMTADGLPLVLVLDDVHWADPTSLRFLQRLIRALCAPWGGRPMARLLIVVTAWEREWNQQCSQPLPDDREADAGHFVAMVRMLDRDVGPSRVPALTEHRLAPIGPGLERAVVAELPGLTPAQRSLVTERAGGSPGLMLELLLKLKQRSKHLFELSDITCALTGRGERALREMTVSYHALVEERLDELDAAEAITLRVASHVGLTYPPAFVQELLATALAEPAVGLSTTQVGAALMRADTPLALVQSMSPRMDEFRLPIYQEILRKQYDESEELQQHVDRRARTLIEHWVDTTPSEDLAVEEHASVLRFAARVLVAGLQRNDSPDDRFTLLKVIAELNMTQIVGKQEVQVWFAYWMGWEQGRTLSIGRRRIDALLLTCFNLRLYVEAAVLGETCFLLVQKLAPSEERDVQLMGLVRIGGDIAKARGLLDDSLRLFQHYLAVAEQALATHGPGIDWLHERWVATSRVGDVLIEQRQYESALDTYRLALQRGHDIVHGLDGGARWRSELAHAHSKVGLALQHLGRMEETVAAYSEALATYERIRADGGASFESRYGELTLRARLGDLLVSMGQHEEALVFLREAVTQNERLMKDASVTPSMFVPTAWSLSRQSDALLALGKPEEALESARQRLLVVDAAVRDFGADAERLWHVLLARRQLARLLSQTGQSAAAVVEQHEAVALAERLIADFGSTANRLQDLAVARLELGKLTPQTRQ